MNKQDTQSTIVKIPYKGKVITIIGTAHISAVSADEVEQEINNCHPDAVCVELDEHRYKSLRGDQRWKNLNITKIIRRKEGMLLLATLALSSYQRRLARKLGIEGGVEIIRAIEVAEKGNIPIHLVDRKLQTTLLRAWRLSSFFSKLKLVSVLISSLFQGQQVSSEEIENLKNSDIIDTLLHELASFLPTVKQVLIDERDTYLATKIFAHAQKTPSLVAVVGAGHLRGVVHRIRARIKKESAVDISALETLPPPGKLLRWAKYIVPVLVGGLIILGFVRGGTERGTEALIYWIACNGILAAIGSIIACAHPVTIIASALAAPITSLNPTIGVGFVAALIEGTVRKPRAGDVERLPYDISSLKGIYKNRVTKILLVFILSSIGSSIGTFVALPLLLP